MVRFCNLVIYNISTFGYNIKFSHMNNIRHRKRLQQQIKNLTQQHKKQIKNLTPQPV